MRKLFLFLLFSMLAARCIGQDEEDEQIPLIIHYSGTNTLLKVVKNYFRSDPYQNKFGFFLNHLMNDPLLTNKTTRLRTDSSLFYFAGVYKSYSPFGFLANRTEVRLVEKEFVVDDSLSLKDTLMVYQLLGFSYNGKTGLESVKDEFDKFNRHYGKHFTSQSSDIKNGEEIIGGARDYFINGITISPASITWAKLDEFQNVFIITLRLKIK